MDTYFEKAPYQSMAPPTVESTGKEIACSSVAFAISKLAPTVRNDGKVMLVTLEVSPKLSVPPT